MILSEIGCSGDKYRGSSCSTWLLGLLSCWIWRGYWGGVMGLAFQLASRKRVVLFGQLYVEGRRSK